MTLVSEDAGPTLPAPPSLPPESGPQGSEFQAQNQLPVKPMAKDQLEMRVMVEEQLAVGWSGRNRDFIYCVVGGAQVHQASPPLCLSDSPFHPSPPSAATRPALAGPSGPTSTPSSSPAAAGPSSPAPPLPIQLRLSLSSCDPPSPALPLPLQIRPLPRLTAHPSQSLSSPAAVHQASCCCCSPSPPRPVWGNPEFIYFVVGLPLCHSASPCHPSPPSPFVASCC